MESPATVVKSALNPRTVIKLALGFLAINALLELTGFSGFFYNPIAVLKAKFASN